MSSFTERHGPPPRPLGPEIPSGVRYAIASWFAERNIEPEDVRRRFFQKHGYGIINDVGHDVRDRWGEDALGLFYRDLRADPRGKQRGHDEANALSPFHVPAPLYLDYLEEAIEMFGDIPVEDGFGIPTVGVIVEPVHYLNDLFAARRIAYRFDENGRAQWHGDEGTYSEVVRPALDALDDARLAGCREEFEAALGHLRAGTAKDREDAIEEAGKAVESAMKVVIDNRGLARPSRKGAESLWQAFRDGDVIETPTHHAILATAQLRN
jgi:hypothetical protein